MTDLNVRVMGDVLHREHHVYGMLCRDGKDGPGYVKFGMSSRIGERLSQLRTNCPIPARYFVVIDVSNRIVAERVESALHEKFQGRRSTGEWFRFDFEEPADKKAFNDGCRQVFWAEFGRLDRWWSKVSVKELDKYNRERRRRLDFDKLNRIARARTKQRQAWRELDQPFGS